MRQAATVQQTQAANQSDQGDFNAAFADLLGEEAKPKVNPAPASSEEDDDEIEEVNDETVAVEKTPGEGIDPIEKIEASAKAAREKWQLQKENKELKAQLEKLAADGKKGINVDSENPLREIGKLKGWSKDDIVNKALEALEDEGFTEAEAKAEVKTLSQEEIIAKVKAELKKEQEAEAEEKQKMTATETAINNFKTKIKTFAVENAEKYPLIDGLGGVEAVYKTIEDDYMTKEKEYGVEWAQKNMMTVDQASKKVNEMLASSVRNALKSDHVRKYILAAIKEDGSKNAGDNQLEDFFQLQDEPHTLTNSVHKKVTDPKDSRELTDDERFKQAFAYLE